MTNLNKKALIELIAEKEDLTKKAATEIIDLIIDSSVKTLKKGGTVDINGFGKFSVKRRKTRKGINPATKEKIQIPATKVPAFKAAKALKEAVK